jgi:hypothetical protein
MKNNYASFLLFLITIFFGEVKAQENNYPILSMEIRDSTTSNNYDVNGNPTVTDSTVFGASMNILLYDTVGISSIAVLFGRSEGVYDLLQKTFTFNSTGTFPDGTSYYSSGLSITLGLGEFTDLKHYSAELIVHRTNGSRTDIISFNR